jgi:hypothetical protein
MDEIYLEDVIDVNLQDFIPRQKGGWANLRWKFMDAIHHTFAIDNMDESDPSQ